MIAEKILSKMDKTLDQLIANAEAVQYASKLELDDYEMEAMQKTQTSLLAHLIFLDKSYDEKKKNRKSHARKEVFEKLQTYEKLNASFLKEVRTKWNIPKRRRKSKS